MRTEQENVSRKEAMFKSTRNPKKIKTECKNISGEEEVNFVIKLNRREDTYREKYPSSALNRVGLETLIQSVHMKKTKKVIVKKNQTTKNEGISTNKTDLGTKRNFQGRGRAYTLRRKRIKMAFQEM